jgi:hypothetical protein
VPAMQSLDRNSNVIFIGSFSKLLFPSLRMGYVVLSCILHGSLFRSHRDRAACFIPYRVFFRFRLRHFADYRVGDQVGCFVLLRKHLRRAGLRASLSFLGKGPGSEHAELLDLSTYRAQSTSDRPVPSQPSSRRGSSDARRRSQLCSFRRDLNWPQPKCAAAIE